ncbi:MAG: phage integrase SAM-like domain-containing protein [Armatimonadetes bacterium]|nr:phage integrase SAM-like domain-containing protein [Armatimonadota bacterium]
MTEHHKIMGGKLHVYRRAMSTNWQCSAYLKGRNWRVSTKTDSLALAKEFAEDWYLTLRGKERAGTLKSGKTFNEAADQFLREVEALIAHDRGQHYVRGHQDRLRAHLRPFFGTRIVSDITPGFVQEYRIHRSTSKRNPATGELIKPARNTIHQEIVTLRQVLKTANRQGWIAYVPDLKDPFKAPSKISHRGWFSHDEYRRLYEATRARAANPLKPRWKWACEQLHDYVLLVCNSGLRPDEAARLEFRDVTIVRDEATREKILEIEVRGKRGLGYCKSMPGAVRPFERLRERPRAVSGVGQSGEGRNSRTSAERRLPLPTDLLFPKAHTELLNSILDELDLKKDRDGNWRTAYSLRHSYICFRLLEGANIYEIAKNCRTSIEIIQKHYAAHLKNMIDASAINLRKKSPRPSRHNKAA